MVCSAIYKFTVSRQHQCISSIAHLCNSIRVQNSSEATIILLVSTLQIHFTNFNLFQFKYLKRYRAKTRRKNRTDSLANQSDMPGPRYADEPDWSDVTPIPLDDGGPNALASIAYTAEYSEAMSYLRAVMAANEYSTRALALTEHLIGLNAANYTVWSVPAKMSVCH